jgi:hypothetical protein
MRICGLIVLLRAANRIVCAAENKADDTQQRGGF